MTNKIKNILVKIFAMTLAIIMAFPANIFASALSDTKDKNKYTASSYIMGEEEKATDETETTSTLLKSDLSTEETDDYIIEKTASLSKSTGEIAYKIAVKAKTPVKIEENSTEKLKASFAINPNSGLTELKADKVMALDKDGNETEKEFKQETPGLFDPKSDIETFKLTTDKEQYGLVYYLSAKLDKDALANIDNDKEAPILALDMVLANENNDNLYINSYKLTKRTEDTEDPAEITIDEAGNIVDEEKFALVEIKANNLVEGTYTGEKSNLFGKTPAQITWTDYILSSTDDKFTYEFNVDENQDVDQAEIKIEFFEAKDKGFVLNNSFTQKLPYSNKLDLQIPQGQLARVELITNVKENTNPKVFSFNNKEIKNPSYVAEEKTETKESSKSNTDDEDPLPAEDSLKENAEPNSSNDIIADKNDQDLSKNSKEESTKKEAPQVSAITLNKDAYIESLADNKDATNITKATNQIAFVLESYNNEEIEWDDFKSSVKTIAKAQNIDQAQTEDILSGLTSGLNEDKYKVATIDIKEAAGATNETSNNNEESSEPTVEEGAELPADKTPDELAKAKLAEESVTLEDFQNYMYELEEKYGLTDEDADRIYTANADAIQALVTKAEEEKTTGDVFATVDNSKYRKTYPYDIDYWTYQYYDQTKNTVNWDIQIETHQVNLAHLDFNLLGLALYAPEAQGLENYTVSIMDYPGNIKKTNRSLIKEQNYPSTGITLAQGALSKSKTSDGLLTFNKTFEKGGLNVTKLPKNLYIHVEATPTDAARFSFYDLGMRLTPDHNYINDMVKQFEDDWAKLVAAMPWILPYKSGDLAAKKFADGFNVVDTRLPAYTYGIGDDNYSTKVYSDKSRSVYGQFVDKNQIKWEVSETLRLQDNDRFVSEGSLGKKILDARFTNSDTSAVEAYIEVLEPNKDGSFTRIYDITTNNDSTFRNGLSQTKNVLKPGTVINYIFTKSVNDPTKESSISINFDERFDDGVGTYGGQREAYIRKLTKEELSARYHVGYQQNLYVPAYNSNPDPKLSGWQFANAEIFRVFENYDMVFCINPGAMQPVVEEFFTNGDKYYIEKKPVNKGSDLEGYLQVDVVNSKPVLTSDDTPEDIYKKLKMAFYYGEELRHEYNMSDEEYSKTMQYTVGSIAATRLLAKQFNESNGWDIGRGDELLTRISEAESNDEWTAEKANSVEIHLYANSKANGSNGSVGSTASEFQNMITGKVYPPVKIQKTDKDGNPLAGARFELRTEGGITLKSWTSSTNPEELFLQPGTYELVEVESPKGNYRKLDPIAIEVTEGYDVREKGDIPLRSQYNQDIDIQARSNKDLTRIETNNYRFFGGRQTVIAEKNKELINKHRGLRGGNYKQNYREYSVSANSNDSNLVSFDSNKLEIKAKNITGAKLEVNKKLLGADVNYHNLPGIEFELKNKTSEETRRIKTDKNGIARFDNLPLNSQWTLKEVVPKDIVVDHDVTWDVDVDDSGNVKVKPSKNDESISSFKDGVLTVINKPITPDTPTGKFRVNKTDKEGKALKGVGFKLYGVDDTGNEAQIKTSEADSNGQYFTGDNGELFFWNLPDGVYYLKETQPLDGYTFEEGNEYTTIYINKGNTSFAKGKVAINPGSTNIKIPDNATDVSVTDPNGKPVSNIVGRNGNIDVSKLNDGDYTISDKTGNKVIVTVKDGRVEAISSPDSTSEPSDPKPGDGDTNPTPNPDPQPSTSRDVTVTNSSVSGSITDSNGNKMADVTSRLSKVSDTEFDLTTTVTGNSYDKEESSGQGVDVLFLVDSTSESKGYAAKEFNRLFPTIRSEIASRFPGDSGRVNVIQYGASKMDSRTLNNKPRSLSGWRQASNTTAAPNDTFKVTEEPDYTTSKPFIDHADEVLKTQINNSKNSGLNNKLIVVTIANTVNEGKLGDATYNLSELSDDAFMYVNQSYYQARNDSNTFVKNGFADTSSRVYSELNNHRDNSKWTDFSGVRDYIKGLPQPTIKRTTTSYIPTGNVSVNTTSNFSSISGSTASVGRLNAGQSKSFTTRVRLNNTTDGNYNVLGNITIDGSSVNLNGPTVNIKTTTTNGTVDNGPDARLLGQDIDDGIKLAENTSDDSILKTLTAKLIPTSYAADANKFANVRFANSQPEDTDFTQAKTITIINIKGNKGRFKLLKVDESNKALEGVSFKLTSKKTSTTTELNTNSNGEINVNALMPDTYTLEETKSLDGYIPTKKKWIIVVDDNGKTTVKEESLFNHNKDESNSLVGYNEISELSAENKTKLSSLGYLIANENDGNPTTIKVVNKQPTYPMTGGNGPKIAFALIGTAVMIAGIAYYGIYVNDKNRRRSAR